MRNPSMLGVAVVLHLVTMTGLAAGPPSRGKCSVFRRLVLSPVLAQPWARHLPGPTAGHTLNKASMSLSRGFAQRDYFF